MKIYTKTDNQMLSRALLALAIKLVKHYRGGAHGFASEETGACVFNGKPTDEGRYLPVVVIDFDHNCDLLAAYHCTEGDPYLDKALELTNSTFITWICHPESRKTLAPPEPPPIHIADRVVVFNKDSIDVGCTTVSRDTIKEIAERMGLINKPQP